MLLRSTTEDEMWRHVRWE